jgi:C-terminal processing protease CtpA/Prc
MKIKSTLSVLACALLAACGGGGGGGTGTGVPLSSGYPGAAARCDIAGQRNWLRDYLNDQYLWYEQLRTADESASDMPHYFASLLAVPVDRYSYAQSTSSFLQFFNNGRRTGYGYSLAWDDAAQTVLKVRSTEPLSPVGLAGLVRGDTIVSMDGFTPAQITAGALATVTTAGIARHFVVTSAAGATRSFTVNSAEYPLSPVLDARVLTAANGARVGYLAYQDFIDAGASALGSAFDTFRSAQVTELVVDLRYNGGGSTRQARNLASMVGGSVLDGEVFAQYRYNAKNSGSNFNQTFTSSLDSLPTAPLETLSRVFVITSAATASASELFINSLRPFKPVILVGSTTYGKPYAFQPRDSCETTYNAVNLEVANARGFSDYSAGFAPTCIVADDLGHALGDPLERRTAAALAYITTGACPPLATALKMQAAPVSAQYRRLNELGFGEISPRQARVD